MQKRDKTAGGKLAFRRMFRPAFIGRTPGMSKRKAAGAAAFANRHGEEKEVKAQMSKIKPAGAEDVENRHGLKIFFQRFLQVFKPAVIDDL